MAGGYKYGETKHFNPRSPCGERLDKVITFVAHTLFQSTLPVWGATAAPFSSTGTCPISIHAPRVGSDI